MKLSLYFAMIYGLITVQNPEDVLLKSVPIGSWGGDHILLIVTESSATVEYDCARGSIDEPLLIDEDGNFKAYGLHEFERGGPQRAGEPPPEQQRALYRGWTDGSRMVLIVILFNTGEEVGTFSLELGRTSRLEKCL